MPMSSKFLTESTGEKNVKIGQYLAKIWTKYDSLVFWATLYNNKARVMRHISLIIWPVLYTIQ